MLGLGKWEVPVNTMFFKGTAKITVTQDNGKFDFKFEVPGFDVPQMDISNLKIDGDFLSADATCEMLKGKMLHTEVTFYENTCKGFVKGPMGIKININGTRVE